MNKNMFVCLKKAGCTNCGNCLTVGKSLHIKNATVTILEEAAFFRRNYFNHGDFKGFVFYGASAVGGTSMDESSVLTLINANKPQEAVTLGVARDMDKPFIHRGNLTDEQLRAWLGEVSDKISLRIELSREIGKLAESIVKAEEELNKTSIFIDASTCQNIQDSTQNRETAQALV